MVPLGEFEGSVSYDLVRIGPVIAEFFDDVFPLGEGHHECGDAREIDYRFFQPNFEYAGRKGAHADFGCIFDQPGVVFISVLDIEQEISVLRCCGGVE